MKNRPEKGANVDLPQFHVDAFVAYSRELHDLTVRELLEDAFHPEGVAAQHRQAQLLRSQHALPAFVEYAQNHPHCYEEFCDAVVRERTAQSSATLLLESDRVRGMVATLTGEEDPFAKSALAINDQR